MYVIPTAHPTKVYSDCCGPESTVFFTNEELWNNVYIEQYCPKCKKFGIWRKK